MAYRTVTNLKNSRRVDLATDSFFVTALLFRIVSRLYQVFRGSYRSNIDGLENSDQSRRRVDVATGSFLLTALLFR